MAQPLEALLEAISADALDRASLGNEQVELGEASFPRDTLVSVSGLKPLRLDVVLFFAKHTAPLNWSVDRVNYVKEAREAGVAPVDFTDRAKLLDFLKGEAHERQAKRPRVSDAAGPSGLVLSDGLLDGPTDTPFSSCRQLHDRNSVLLAKSKSFAPVLELLQAAMKGQLAKPRESKPVAPQLKSNRYKEVQEQKFWQERLGTRDVDELGIDTNASFLADAVQPLPPAMPPHAAPPPAAPPVPVAAAKPARPPPAGAPRPKEKEGGIPIIIVPSGLGSQVLVNLFNVQPFLEDCAFVPWEERKNAGVRKDGMVEIRRRSGRAKPLVYQVTDKPPAKKSPDWARVVAVFVQGTAWQLKEFPFKGAGEGNFLETFAHVSAFFVRFDSEPPPEFVKKWSVNTLVLNKNTRHSDKSVVDGFWAALDSALARKGSSLAY